MRELSIKIPHFVSDPQDSILATSQGQHDRILRELQDKLAIEVSFWVDVITAAHNINLFDGASLYGRN